MKNAYQVALRRPTWHRICAIIFALVGFAFATHAQSVSFTADVAGNPQNFGTVTAGQTSAPRSFTVSGSGLIDDVTINIPSRFQGSLSSSGGFSTNAIVLSPSGGTLAPTTIYLRFAPNAAGTVNRNVFAFTLDSNGDVVASSPTIALTGTGTAASPSIGVSPSALGFGNQIINTQSAPQQITVTGNSLTSTISAVAPNGFLISYNGSAYGTTATLPSTGGTVDVVFLPTQTGNFVGNVTFNSTGASQASVSVSGTGVPVPGNLSVTYSPDPLNFGQAQVGTSTASQSFVVNGSALSSDVTITPTANFQIRTGTNPFSSSPIVLTATNGSISNVTVDVRFTPTQNVAVNTVINETVALSAANANAAVNVRGEATPAPSGASVTASPTSIDFGPITGSGSASTRTLTVSGTGLGSNPITLTPNSPYIQVRNASTGGAFGNTLTIASNNGTVAPTTVEVRIVSTPTSSVPGGPFNQIIEVQSPGATTVPVTITANSNGNISDISITNPSNNSFTFATRPGTFSAAQSFLISGTNLLQDITIAPAGSSGGFFQISKDGVNFTNSDTLKRDGQNNVRQRQIFVRFVPGSQAITVNALIRASSSPAPDQDVSVTGISEPTIRLLEPIGSFGNSVVKNTTSPTRTVRLETFLLTGPTTISFPNDNQDPQRNPDRTPQYEFRYSTGGGLGQNGGNYVKTDTLGNNSEGNRIIDLLVRYAPTRVGASTQDLQFTNAALNGGAPFTLLSQNGRATGFAIAEEPTAQSTAQIVRSNDRMTATINFDLANAPAGQSYGQKRLVIASRTYTLLPTSLFPQDKQNFNPGTTVGGVYQYGTGTTIEASTGTFVVFSGAANSFTVGNLDAGQEYYFYAFEFNDDGLLNAENYKVPNNQPQTPLPVELVSFTAELRNGRVNLNWVTAQEKNNRGFEVERSRDGRSFSKIGFVAGNGTTTVQKEYSLVDATPLLGTSYYRLRQIDTDGTEHASDMVAVHNGAKAEVTVFPNPVSDVLNVRMAGAGIDTKVVVTDMMGRVVLNGKLSLNGTFDMSQLKAGNYIVTVTSGGEKSSHKVVKQ